MKALILPALLLVTACNGTSLPKSSGLFKAKPAAVAPADGSVAAIRPQGRPGDEPAMEPAAAATAPVPATGMLGKTVASLGNAGEPGLWLKTPLVKARAKGKVRLNGKTVEAELIPIDGPPSAGSRASLQLMQALGASLTGLPEVTVSR